MTRRQWCITLGKLVSPAFPVDAGTALVDMLPALSHLPDALFTDETLRAVAMAKRRQSVPAFDEILVALSTYRGRLAELRQLAAPPNADLPQGRSAPLPDEVKAVTELLTSWRQEVSARQVAAAMREPKTARLPDVSLKGEALRIARERRGVRVGG